MAKNKKTRGDAKGARAAEDLVSPDKEPKDKPGKEPKDKGVEDAIDSAVPESKSKIKRMAENNDVSKINKTLGSLIKLNRDLVNKRAQNQLTPIQIKEIDETAQDVRRIKASIGGIVGNVNTLLSNSEKSLGILSQLLDKFDRLEKKLLDRFDRLEKNAEVSAQNKAPAGSWLDDILDAVSLFPGKTPRKPPGTKPGEAKPEAAKPKPVEGEKVKPGEVKPEAAKPKPEGEKVKPSEAKPPEAAKPRASEATRAGSAVQPVEPAVKPAPPVQPANKPPPGALDAVKESIQEAARGSKTLKAIRGTLDFLKKIPYINEIVAAAGLIIDITDAVEEYEKGVGAGGDQKELEKILHKKYTEAFGSAFGGYGGEIGRAHV